MTSAAVEAVLAETARTFGFVTDDLLSPRKPQELAACRRVACFLLHDQLGLSYPEIGRVLGRHHTSVMYNVGVVRKAIEEDPRTVQHLVDIMGRVGMTGAFRRASV